MVRNDRIKRVRKRKSMIDIAERKRKGNLSIKFHHFIYYYFCLIIIDNLGKISLINKRTQMKNVRLYSSALELKIKKAKCWIKLIWLQKILVTNLYQKFNKLRCQREDLYSKNSSYQTETINENTGNNFDLQEHSI